MEDRTEKSAVTPGPLAPARELLGELLLQLNQPADALTGIRGHDEEGAEPLPRRVRRGEGGGCSPRTAPRRATYYGQLLKICERGDTPGRPELAEARKGAAAGR